MSEFTANQKSANGGAVALVPQLSIVIPCFNERNGLNELCRRVTAAASAELGDSYELILIDDGSTDGSWQLMREISGSDARVIAVKLSRNHGHQLALTAGLSVVRGAEILVLDGDLQDPPELLPALRRKMQEEDADVVYGKRIGRPGESVFKLVTAHLFYRWLRKMAYVDIPADTGDFRLMKRHVSDLIARMPERDRFIRGMVSWLGFKQVPFEYTREKRFEGRTKYSLKNMIRFASDALFGFSMVPLRLSAFFATTSMLVAIGFTIYAVLAWLVLNTEPGWPSLVAAISIFFAVLFAILNIFGEILGRIYFEIKDRPLFIISEITNCPIEMPMAGGRGWGRTAKLRQ